VSSAPSKTRKRIQGVEQETRRHTERVEREAQSRIKDAEQQREAAQLAHDVLNETVDKKYVQAKIALLVAAKSVSSSGATEIVDAAKNLYSRVNFWEKEPGPEISPPLLK
jgi:hypothetical protein